MAIETLSEAQVEIYRHAPPPRLTAPANLAFISADFGHHIVGNLVRSVFSLLSPSKYRVSCLGTRPALSIERDGGQRCVDLSSKAPHQSSEIRKATNALHRPINPNPKTCPAPPPTDGGPVGAGADPGGGSIVVS